MFQKVAKEGYTIVVTKLYFDEKNFIKLNIGIGAGKKLHDKRDALKEKDLKRESDRAKKEWSR
jgi:SsrA-binding protein